MVGLQMQRSQLLALAYLVEVQRGINKCHKLVKTVHKRLWVLLSCIEQEQVLQAVVGI